MNKRALVTGGAGFLGSHLVRSLLADEYHVTVIDNLQTGSLDNLTGVLDSIDFKHWDVIEPYSIPADEYWNLACAASPPKYQANPTHTFKTNIWGVSNAIDNAHRYGGKVFQASTSEVYGDPTTPVQTETYWGNVNPIGIRSNYDEGKRAAETLLMDSARQFQVDVRIARIFNTYGPNLDKDDGRVVTNFINQALRGKPITIYGSGEQTRSFCYVSDLIRGFRMLMDSDVASPVNLGNPDEFTMNELADLILDMTGSKSELIYLELPGDDPKQRCPDIRKARALGWEPTVNLEQGLQRTIDYFKSKL